MYMSETILGAGVGIRKAAVAGRGDINEHWCRYRRVAERRPFDLCVLNATFAKWITGYIGKRGYRNVREFDDRLVRQPHSYNRDGLALQERMRETCRSNGDGQCRMTKTAQCREMRCPNCQESSGNSPRRKRAALSSVKEFACLYRVYRRSSI